KSPTGNRPVLGVPEGPYLEQMPHEGMEWFRSHLQRLQEAGYTVKNVSVLENLDELIHNHHILIDREMKDIHSDWFNRFHPLYRPLTKNIILRGKEITDEELKN